MATKRKKVSKKKVGVGVAVAATAAAAEATHIQKKMKAILGRASARSW